MVEVAIPEVEQDRGPVPEGSTEGLLPLDYMLAVIRDVGIDEARRDRMAVAAAPYLHAKVGEGGKKDAKAKGAKDATGGKFAPATAPRLVVSNKR